MLEIKEKEVTLAHHKTSEQKTFTLRLFRPGDEEAVTECVTEEYGDTYYRREYYDKDLLNRQIENGLYIFLAYCGDNVCGIQTIVSYAPKEPRIEAASQIFRKAYRGYGLPFELVKYTYEVAKSLHPSCIYASMVVFHDITQKMCTDVGMIPTAFNFGSHLTSKMHNSFALGSSEKYGQAIMILPVDKQDAGDIYIHSDIAEPVGKIYGNLGVKYNIISQGKEGGETAGEKTDLEISVNEREQSISVKVYVIGRDLVSRITEIKQAHPGKYWTVQLILPVDTDAALKAYEELVQEGFFFTGVRALCSEKEQIFMQYTGDVYFNFDEFKLTDGFKSLLEDVLRYYGETTK